MNHAAIIITTQRETVVDNESFPKSNVSYNVINCQKFEMRIYKQVQTKLTPY